MTSINHNGLGIKDKVKLNEYFRSLYSWRPEGAHDSANEIRGELGSSMKKLFSLPLGSSKLDSILEKIRQERKSSLSLEEWKKQYEEYLLIVIKRQEHINRYNHSKRWYQSKMENVETLDEDNWNVWGSIRQIKFGKVVIDTLGIDLDPVFGALLRPTGGIVGPGNNDVYEGIHEDPVVMHGIVHDAGGYCYEYHNSGPGYNYIGTKLTLFPTSSSLSTQFSGIRFWAKFIYNLENSI